MLLTLLKSKLAPVTLTETCLEYEGSITIDAELAEKAGLVAGEQVHVLNYNNGSRLITYVIIGERGSGIICLNGPAARMGLVGDRLAVLSYVQLTPEETKQWKPVVVKLAEGNQAVK